MSSIELTAKSLDEAKKQAAAKLGVDVDALTVTVLEETKGLFGKSNVKIRAEAGSAAAEKPAKAAKPKAPAKKAAAKEEAPVEEAPVEAAPAPKEEKPAKPAAKGKAVKEKAPAKAAEKAEAPADAEEEGGAEVEATAEDEQFIADLVANLLEAGSLDASVSESSRNGKYVNIVLDGRDVAHLVGKHGEVLNALQFLVNVTLTQQRKNGVRATIDGGNYRRKREEQLTKLATQIAAEVGRRQEEAVLDALPAFERRIIHKALSTIEGIQTYSEGEEPNRRVVIAPAE